MTHRDDDSLCVIQTTGSSLWPYVTADPPPHLSVPTLPGLRHRRVHEQEDGLLWWQLDPFPDDPHELSHCDVRGHQVLPFVDVHNLRSGHLLHDHLTNGDRIIGHTRPTRRPLNSQKAHSPGPGQGTCCGFWLTLCIDVLGDKKKSSLTISMTTTVSLGGQTPEVPRQLRWIQTHWDQHLSH